MQVGGGRPGSSLVDDGALNSSSSAAARRRRERRRPRRALPREFCRTTRSLPEEQAKITLVEAGPELFSMFKPELRAYTKKALEKRGVEVLLGQVVASVTPTRVTFKSGRVLRAHTLVWGAGLQAHPADRVRRR